MSIDPDFQKFEKPEACKSDCRSADAKQCEEKRNPNYDESEIKGGLVKPCNCPICHDGAWKDGMPTV